MESRETLAHKNNSAHVQYDAAMTEHRPISPLMSFTPYTQAINAAWRRSEPDCISDLIAATEQSDAIKSQIHDLALDLSERLRQPQQGRIKSSLVQGLLQQFSLSSQEGVALMCLAEALLRIPDASTRDQLIRDKINQGNWKQHLGQSQLIFVNAAAWGLMLTGKLMHPPKSHSLSNTLTALLARSSRGIIRKAVDVAMRMMGEQFVTGENIAAALKHAKSYEQQGFRYSYDMLGEAALTADDAERYFQSYVDAIHAIGKAAEGQDVYQSPGISIKLSALHPRYQRAQIERVHQELYPKILELARYAKHYDIGLNIDAEESERLELSLNLLERLCFEPELAGWKGIGFVIQAYQKRCVAVVDYLIDLAQRSEKRLMIRLVKGAYWDSEIKKAQVEGMTDYPVFTRKTHTDLSYLHCAAKLLAAPAQIYPQFATHNAHSLAAIYYMADPDQYYPGQYEFQCLHGMGEALYTHVVGSTASGQLGIPCRIYAPVGHHETLLAYLVRRLLENGANSSFVNRIADQSLDLTQLVRHPRDIILTAATSTQPIGQANPQIPTPSQLYASIRDNSLGLDLHNDSVIKTLDELVQQQQQHQWHAEALGNDLKQCESGASYPVINPANHADIVGEVKHASPQQIEQALINAEQAQQQWAATPVAERAACLERAARLLQQRMQDYMVLLCRESGKTFANGIAEVREAIDFLNYYAAHAKYIAAQIASEQHAHSTTRAASAEQMPLALGPVLCISPWNFPLAIFLGQIAAALVAGNPVLAKPAEQSPLVAAMAVELLWEAGISQACVQLLPGTGEDVGAVLSADPRIQAVMFTGSTEVAKILQNTLAQRINKHGKPVVLIAETGGQNALIVDSSALTEQAVTDIISSAFDSAGQRCSALRVLCVQEDNADVVIDMLKGAMQQLQLGNPRYLQTDVGPVIDREAYINIDNHIVKMRRKGYPVHQLMHDQNPELAQGHFVVPTLIELPDLDDLEREVFGPVLHVIRFAQGKLNDVIAAINAKGYGLTLGLHTRIDEHIRQVIDQAHVGNLYINRNIVGAVVGVQPFGGEGLSGTGPKAGGPLYLHRLMASHQLSLPATPFSMKAYQMLQHGADQQAHLTDQQSTYAAFMAWANFDRMDEARSNALHPHADAYFEMTGPTGELNLYHLAARQRILCIADQLEALKHQCAMVLHLGSQVVLSANDPVAMQLMQVLPVEISKRMLSIADPSQGDVDAILHHGNDQQLLQLQKQVAERTGAIISIHHRHSMYADNNSTFPFAAHTLLVERAVSINTTAAGGNASLMMLDDA